MVDVARGIAEDIPVDIILVAEGKNRGIPLRQSLHAFFFRNPLPAIRHDAGVFLNILERKEPLAGDTRFRGRRAIRAHSSGFGAQYFQ